MTLQDFKKVRFNKKMRDLRDLLIARDSEGYTQSLYDCYKNPSCYQVCAYYECCDFYNDMIRERLEYYNLTSMQLVSFNSQKFSIAFIIDDKLFYITKSNKLYCEMEA